MLMEQASGIEGNEPVTAPPASGGKNEKRGPFLGNRGMKVGNAQRLLEDTEGVWK